MFRFFTCLCCVLFSARGLLQGALKENALLGVVVKDNGYVKQCAWTLDANWRWFRQKDSMENCIPKYCLDPKLCAQQCALEGVGSLEELRNTYGVDAPEAGMVRLKYVVKHDYGVNVGSRLYLLDALKRDYYTMDLRGKELSYWADMSEVACGMNAAVYFVEMDREGERNMNTIGAQYGLGYGDAQCPNDIKFVGSFVNTNKTGACSNEFDIWEANRHANAFTAHVCSIKKVKGCTQKKDCGEEQFRNQGWCDKAGADVNLYRLGQKYVYGFGPQYRINTKKPFQIITRFHQNAQGDLVRVERLYKQEGREVQGGNLTDSGAEQQSALFKEFNHHGKLGGLKAMGEAFKRGMVLVVSLWDDSSPAAMKWLDSIYPEGSNATGAERGPCRGLQDPPTVRKNHPDAYVRYWDFSVKMLNVSAPPTDPPVNAFCAQVKQCFQ